MFVLFYFFSMYNLAYWLQDLNKLACFDRSDTQATVQFLLSLLSQFLSLWRHGVLVWSAKGVFPELPKLNNF